MDSSRTTCSAFVSGSNNQRRRQSSSSFASLSKSRQQRTTTAIYSILDDINKKIKEEEEEGRQEGGSFTTGFNPLNYSTKAGGAGAATGAGGNNRISIRKTIMAEMLNELLSVNVATSTGATTTQAQAAKDAEEKQMMITILQNYKDFLLEPLEDMNAVLDDPDSIYTPEMNTREKRFEAYRLNIEDRVQKAKNTQVKKVLQTMKEYVLGFE